MQLRRQRLVMPCAKEGEIQILNFALSRKCCTGLVGPIIAQLVLEEKRRGGIRAAVGETDYMFTICNKCLIGSIRA